MTYSKQEASAAKEAAEAKLKELDETIAQSKSASSEISGRAELAESRLAAKEKDLIKAEAALKASQESIKALDAEKVRSSGCILKMLTDRLESCTH